MENNKRKIKSLQTLRALAFLGIFAEHSYGADYGAWGVSVFFILSGFLMIYSYKGRYPEANIKAAGALAVKKIKKLYPLHLVMIAVVICMMVFDKSFKFTKVLLLHYAKLLAANILLIQTWLPRVDLSISMNGPAWYLSVSLFLYFMFPFIADLINKPRKKQFPVLMILAIYIIQLTAAFIMKNFGNLFSYSDNWNQWFTYCFPIFRLGDFIMGCLLGYIICNGEKISMHANKTIYTIAEAAVVLITIFVLPKMFIDDRYFWGSEWFKYSLLYSPFSLLLIYLFFRKEGYITKFLTNKATIWIGDMSPYAFLIHVPVINIITTLIRPLEIALYNKAPDINMYYILTVRALICLTVTLLLSCIAQKLFNQHIKAESLADNN